MAVLYYLGMKTILFAIMVLTVCAAADVYPMYHRPIDKGCERIKYDTETNVFTPEECPIKIRCDVDSPIYGESVVYAERFPKMKPKFLLQKTSNGMVVEIPQSMFVKLIFRDNDPQQFCSYTSGLLIFPKD